MCVHDVCLYVALACGVIFAESRVAVPPFPNRTKDVLLVVRLQSDFGSNKVGHIITRVVKVLLAFALIFTNFIEILSMPLGSYFQKVINSDSFLCLFL